jgi:tetratricopeptide (TPR) repeat protein
MELRWIPAVILAGALALPARAHAQTDPEAAEALFLAGRDAMDRKDYAAACPKFAESDRLDPSSGARINLADCEEKLGRVAAAWRHWQEAIELIPSNDPRLPGVMKRRSDVEKRVPRVTLKSSAPLPASAVVLRDGVEVGIGALEVPLPLDPGAHTVIVRAPGHKDWKEDFTLKESERRDLTLGVGEVEATAPPPVTPPVVREGPPSKTGRYVGYGLLGLGGVGIVVGSITGALAIDRKNALTGLCQPVGTCTPAGADAASAGRAFATVSTVAVIVGAVAIAGGVVLVLTAPKAQKTIAIGPGLVEGTF